MSTRELPDFLKHGDQTLQAPLRRDLVHIIGRGFPEARPPAEGGAVDVRSAEAEAARGWLKAVELGLIGGKSRH